MSTGVFEEEVEKDLQHESQQLKMFPILDGKRLEM